MRTRFRPSVLCSLHISSSLLWWGLVSSCQGVIGIWSVPGGFKPIQALRAILEPVSRRTKFSHYLAEMLLVSARIAVALEKYGKLLLRHMRKYLLIISYGYKILHHLSTGSGRTRKGFRVKQIINIFFELILKQMPVKFQKIKCCESNGIAPILSDSHCQDCIFGHPRLPWKCKFWACPFSKIFANVYSSTGRVSDLGLSK